MQKARGSERSQELHYAGVISPPFLDFAIAASWIAGGESLSFHGQICFRINIGCIKRNVAQPRPDCVEINSSAKQVSCGCMTNRMRAYTFGFQRRDFYRRAFRMTCYKRVDSKPCYGIAISIEEQGIGGIPSSDERPEFSHCLFPEWAEPNLPALSTNLHRASARCVPSQIVDRDSRGLCGSCARIVEKQKQGVISMTMLSRAIWGTKKFVDLILFHIRNRIRPCSLKGNSTDLCAPFHVLWAAFTCEPGEGVEGCKPLIPRGDRATSSVFQVREKICNNAGREVVDYEPVDR